jgi:hypothetical protein
MLARVSCKTVQDFVVYHNADQQGHRFNNRRAIRPGQSGRWRKAGDKNNKVHRAGGGAVGYNFEATKIFMPAGHTKRVYAPYIEHVPPDVTACIFWLKNRDPQNWRDAQLLEHVRGKYIISDRPMSDAIFGERPRTDVAPTQRAEPASSFAERYASRRDVRVRRARVLLPLTKQLQVLHDHATALVALLRKVLQHRGEWAVGLQQPRQHDGILDRNARAARQLWRRRVCGVADDNETPAIPQWGRISEKIGRQMICSGARISSRARPSAPSNSASKPRKMAGSSASSQCGRLGMFCTV